MDILYHPVGHSGQHITQHSMDEMRLARIATCARQRVAHKEYVRLAAMIAGTCGGISAGIGTFVAGIAKLGNYCNRNAELVVATSFIGACFAGLLAAKGSRMLAWRFIDRKRRKEFEQEYQEIADDIRQTEQTNPYDTLFDKEQGLYVPSCEYSQVELTRHGDDAAPFETALRNSASFRKRLGLNTLRDPFLRRRVDDEILEMVRNIEGKPQYSYNPTMNFFVGLRGYAPSRRTIRFLGNLVEPTLQVIAGLLSERYKKQDKEEEKKQDTAKERV